MVVVIVLALAACAVLGLLAAANWLALANTVRLWLFVTEVDTPVGLIVLVVASVSFLANLALAIHWSRSMRIESQRFARDLQAERERADRAEESRLTELRNRRLSRDLQMERERADLAEASRLTALREDVAREMVALRAAVEAASHTMTARIDHADEAMTHAVHEAVYSISASLSMVEDKLDRALHRTDHSEPRPSKHV